jgi:prepilin-type N-terminal cleavage/methylation domain-containing protein
VLTARRVVRGLRRQGGFTLMELLVALAIIGILAALFSAVISSAVQRDAVLEESSSIETEARAALDNLSKELRQAYTGDSATAPIESMSATSLQFLSAANGNPFPLRRIGYQLSSGNLERRAVTSSDTDGPPWVWPNAITSVPWTTVLGSITGTTVFKYYDANGAEITDYSQVSKVHTVDIKLVLTTKTLPKRQLTYETSVTLRTAQ